MGRFLLITVNDDHLHATLYHRHRKNEDREEMVERIDDLISFLAYSALPTELFVSVWLYPRFFLAMPVVARLFGIFLFLFSICCGGIHFLRAVQRTDTIQMEVLSWATAFTSMGTAIFLALNIRIFFREVDKGLRETSNDNAVLVQAKRKEETFRGCMSFQLRNPLYLMGDRIRNLQQQCVDSRHQPRERNTGESQAMINETLKEIDALRESLLHIVNSSLDPEVSTMILAAAATTQQPTVDTTTTQPMSSAQADCFLLDVRRLIQQAIGALQLEDKEIVAGNDSTNQMNNPDEEDPLLVPPRLVWRGEVDERTIPLQGVRLFANVAQVSQTMYNLFSHAVANLRMHDETQDKVVVKYHLSLVYYDEEVGNGLVIKPAEWNSFQADKGLPRAVLVIRLEGLYGSQASIEALRNCAGNLPTTTASFHLCVAADLLKRSGGSIQFEPDDPKTSNHGMVRNGITKGNLVAHIVVRVEG